jgi:hypothetical protein
VLLGLCSSFALIGMCFSFMLSLGFMFFYHVIIVPFLYDVSIFFLRTIIALPLWCVHILPSHYYCPSFTMCPFLFFLHHYCVFPLCYIHAFFFMSLLCLLFTICPYSSFVLHSYFWCISFTLSLHMCFTCVLMLHLC